MASSTGNRPIWIISERIGAKDSSGLNGAKLLDPGCFPSQFSKIVKARPTDTTSSHDLNLVNTRRMQREDALYTDPIRYLPHRE